MINPIQNTVKSYHQRNILQQLLFMHSMKPPPKRILFQVHSRERFRGKITVDLLAVANVDI